MAASTENGAMTVAQMLIPSYRPLSRGLAR
jgi:hypothetical protein